MIFLLNLIGFFIEMIICPILMIPFLLWRLLVNIEIRDPDKYSEKPSAEPSLL
jgi:hypothetical protein